MLLKKNVSVIIIIFILICAHAGAQQSVTDAQKVYGFAEWLFEQGEYERAAGEYLRFLFLNSNKNEAALLLKIGLCYKKAENYSKAITTFHKALALIIDDNQKEAVYYELAYCFFKLELYQDSLSVVLQSQSVVREKSSRLILLETADSLCLTDWDTAFLLMDAYLKQPQADYYDLATELNNFTVQGQSLPYKSPVFSGILSAVIPGSGKIYAGNFMDGLFSLITVGIFGGMAAYSFYEDGAESVPGWIYTAVGGIFYLGNIYGSVTAAHLYNERQEQLIIQKVRETVAHKFP
ncbi:MAG: hypothetical protein JW822_10255 [Spirochaetales bacterium]|nr:hypothetical protein [Spirochaetales bacterium]